MTVRAEAQIDLARVDDGSPGAPGTNGATFTPSVAADGDISWTNDGGLPNPPTQNIMGPQGDPGTPGTPGAAGVSVTAVEPQYYLSTSDASATGGSWSSTPQTFVSGRYYWTREYVTFSDGTHDTSTEVYNAGMTKAAQDAYDALDLADDTNQYFWYAPTGDDTGAHITEVPQDEWNDNTDPNYHSGGNLLARSNGIAVRDGMVELASFGTTGARVGKMDGARTVIGNGSTTIYTPDNVPAFNVSSGSGSSQQTVVIELGIDFDIENKNTPVAKTYTDLNSIVTGTSFAVRFVYGEADDETEITFVKGTSSTVNHTFTGSDTAIISFAYNGTNQITFTWTGGTATGPITLWPYSATYVATVYDAVVDAPYGYSSGGAQIGSFINVSSYTGDQNQLSTSDQYLELTEVINQKGNAFAHDDVNGWIECLYDGIVLFSATIRLYNNFTAQDIIGYGLTNYTQSTTFNNAQFRVPPNMTAPNQNVFTPTMPVPVSAGDKIRVRIRNTTGSRGMINLDSTFLSATYLAPVLT